MQTSFLQLCLVTSRRLQDSLYRSRFVNAAHKFASGKSRLADWAKVPVCSSGCTKTLILLLHCICPESLGFSGRSSRRRTAVMMVEMQP